jgi:hypothetical protein
MSPPDCKGSHCRSGCLIETVLVRQPTEQETRFLRDRHLTVPDGLPSARTVIPGGAVHLVVAS